MSAPLGRPFMGLAPAAARRHRRWRCAFAAGLRSAGGYALLEVEKIVEVPQVQVVEKYVVVPVATEVPVEKPLEKRRFPSSSPWRSMSSTTSPSRGLRRRR